MSPRTLLLLLLARAALCWNPGVVLRLHKKNLSKIITVGTKVVNPFIKNITITDPIEASILTLHKTELVLADVQPSQIVWPSLDKEGYLECEVLKVGFKLVGHGEIKAAFFKSKGTVLATGFVSKVVVRFAFEDFSAARKDKPFVKVELQQFEFDTKSMIIKLDFRLIPDSLINNVISLFKSVVVKSIQSSIAKSFKLKFNKAVNEFVEREYPASVSLGPYGLSLQTLLSSKPTVTAMEVVLGLDGTFFDTAAGYSRSKDAAAVSTHKLDRFFGDLTVTSYSVNTFFEAVFNKDFVFDLAGTSLTLRSELSHPDVRMSSRGIRLDKYPLFARVQRGKDFLESRSEVSLLLDAEVHKSVDFFLDFFVREFAFHKLEFRSDKPFMAVLGRVVRLFMMALFAAKQKFSLGIPDVNLPFDTKLKDLGVDIEDGYLQVGASVDVDHVTKWVLAKLRRGFWGGGARRTEEVV